MVNFYPNMQRGRLRLVVNLDGRGAAEKTGVLDVTNFALLGDSIVSELASNEERRGGVPGATAAPRGKPKTQRQVIDFDSLKGQFAVGAGQFVLSEADLRGPIFGATVRGKADFRTRTVNMAGTYGPLQGLTAGIALIPGLGELLTGPRKEGVFAITFAVQGPMAEPQVLINPFSLFTPGFFREISQVSFPSTQVTPADCTPAPRRPGTVTRSSSTPASPVPQVAPQVGQSGGDVGGPWSSTSDPAVPKKR